MPNLDDEDDQVSVLDGVDDPVVAFSDTVEVLRASELRDPMGTRVCFKLSKAPNDPLLGRFVEGFELALSGGGEMNRVSQASKP